jgi:hypothetical protein
MRLFSCFAAFLLLWSCSAVSTYKDDPEVLKWENDIKEFEKRDKAEADPQNAILFTGSSSIRLWDGIREDMKPYPVIQRGYGGAKFSDFAVYCNRIIYPHQFKALAIFIANDITGDEKDKEPREVLNLYKYVVSEVRSKYQTEPIFFIQITPTPSRWKVWDKISEVNGMIKKYSDEKEGLYFIETADQFFGTDGKPRSELFRDDQLHLNEDGYKIWSTAIRSKMDEVLNKY